MTLLEKTMMIQRAVSAPADGLWGHETADKILAYMQGKAPELVGEEGESGNSKFESDWPLERDAAGFYGRNDGSAKWESDHLVMIGAPYAMQMDGKPIARIRCHRRVADSLASCLREIKAHYKTQANINAVGLNQFDGCYNYRRVRGGSRLSMHAFGAAIDFDAAHNALGQAKGYRMPAAVVEIFTEHGWRWGGNYSGRKDPMHFEACR